MQSGIMSFAPAVLRGYIRRMASIGTGKAFFARAALAAVAVGGLTGAAFAAWVENGPDMLVALAASGLAWCF